MSDDPIQSWVEKARQSGGDIATVPPGVQVIRRAPQNRGSLIMEIAEKLRPWITKMFEGVRDENDMLVQPARVRGIAINMAQRIVNEQEAA